MGGVKGITSVQVAGPALQSAVASKGQDQRENLHSIMALGLALWTAAGGEGCWGKGITLMYPHQLTADKYQG